MIACTVISANYVPAVRVLVASFRRFHPAIPFYVVLAAEEHICQAVAAEGIKVLRPDEMEIPTLPALLERYTCLQTIIALKPAILRYLLARGHDSVIYLDADILVTASLAPLLEQVASHSLCLTPHLHPAPRSARREKIERSLLLTGIYNAGFIGIANHEESRRFVAWWEERLRTHNRKDKKHGYHYDQRWLDLSPSFVCDTHIVRDQGCNVGQWCLTDVTVTRDGSGYRANDVPLRFFHFSGFDPLQPEKVSRHAGRLKVSESGFAPELFADYAQLLRSAGWEQYINAPWPWDPPWPWHRWFTKSASQNRR